MKRVLLASILGLAASVASSFGQAQYFFDTYAGSLGAPAGVVTWSSVAGQAPAGLGGTAVADGTFTADLLWHDEGNGLSGDLGLAVPTSTHIGYGAGWIQGPIAIFDPSWTGAALDLTISLTGVGQYVGGTGSLSWTEPAQATGTGTESFQAMPQVPITVSIVTTPEPTTLALAGLGLAGLAIFRKRA